MASGTSNSNRIAPIAKAGKRSGGYTEPPAPKPEKSAGREMGFRQFIAKQQLTVKKEVNIIVYDKALQAFVERTRTITISADHVFDPTRGRLVSSPVFKERKTK